MGSYFWEQYHFDYIFEILIRENARFGTPPRILLSITDPTHNWLLAPAPPSVETPGTGCHTVILSLSHSVCLPGELYIFMSV